MSSFFARHADKIVQVSESGCMIWLGAIDRKGYGRHGVPNARRTASAHRSAYSAAHGQIPHGLGVCHRCDVPACVNPDHLFLGTQKDNAQDMARKGRHGRSRITPASVRTIRQRLAAGENHGVIAKAFGVNRSTITQIHRQKTWRHVQ